VPGGGHSDGVVIEFVLRDGSVVVPEVSEELKAGGVAEAHLVVAEWLEVFGRTGDEELADEEAVGIVVGAEDLLFVEVAAVGLGNLGGGETVVIGLDWRIDWSNEVDACDLMESGRTKREGDESVGTAAAVGVDRGCVGGDLGLGSSEGLVGGT